METKEYKLDRSKWGTGPWDDEPEDLIKFEHKNVPCIMRRNTMGSWCGYAAVNPGHPWHGKHYDDPDVEVHGGLTYSNGCAGDICHVPSPGEPDNVHWFGFDCSHVDDKPPYRYQMEYLDTMSTQFYGDSYTYKTVEYVKDEIYKLVDQILENA